MFFILKVLTFIYSHDKLIITALVLPVEPSNVMT